MTTLDDINDNALSLASDVLMVEGRIRFFKDWEQEIIARLAERKVTDEVGFRPGPGPFAMLLKPVRVSGGQTRRFDYANLKKTNPALYSTHVVETPPANPVKLTFKAAGKWSGSSRTWDDIRSKGWVAVDNAWGETRRKPAPYFSADREAKTLFEVRGRIKPLDEKRSGLRSELAGLIVPDPTAKLESVTYGDGLILPALNPPKREIDLSAAEKHPMLKQFVKYSNRVDSVRWTFSEDVESNNDEETEEDWIRKTSGRTWF